MVIDWILDKLGYNYKQKQKILKVIWKIMGATFLCAFAYGLYKMACQIF